MAASLLLVCAVLFTGQFGLASAAEHPAGASGAGTEVVRPLPVDSSQRDVTRYSAQSDRPEPTDGSGAAQDRRYVIGALGVVLVAAVLLLRRKRGKQSFVVRWRKRS